MRTTVEFSQPLLRAAKARAAEQGESLKSLLARAVEVELGRQRPAATGRRAMLPMFGDPAGPVVNLTNAGIERALVEGDARAVALGPRRGGRFSRK